MVPKLNNQSDIEDASSESTMGHDGYEVSVTEAFSKLLSQKENHDLLLEGSDGVQVSAVKCALRARSKAFEDLLGENFGDVIKVDFPGAAIAAIVEYVHNSTAELLGWGIAEDDTERSANEKALAWLKTVFWVIRAAEHFGLPLLIRKANASISFKLEDSPALAFPILEECHKADHSIQSDLEEMAWRMIRSDAIHIASNASVIGILTPARLEEVLCDDEVSTDKRKVLEIRSVWTSFHLKQAQEELSLTKQGAACAQVKLRQTQEELSKAKEELGSIKDTAFQQRERLAEVLLSEVLYSIPGGLPGGLPVWKTSKSHEIKSSSICSHPSDILDNAPPMIIGTIHRWTVAIESSYALLGIAKLPCVRFDGIHGLPKMPWVFYSSGRTYHNGSMVGNCDIGFSKGSCVTFLLNLLPHGDKFGTLYASVDGSAFFKLFENLQNYLDEDGFVPAASFIEGSIRLTAYDQVF